MNDIYYLHYINLLTEIGPVGLWKLKTKFHSFQLACQANLTQLEQAGLSTKLARVILKHCQQLTENSLLIEKTQLAKNEISLCGYEDSNYPKLLREIAVPPLLLYARGNINLFNSFPSIAVVGTRKCSSYGIAATKKIVEQLCTVGATTVSGLAFGIDTVAHKTSLTLAVSGGKTIAVLPGGIDNESIYPSSNMSLGVEIAKNGCIISEKPPGSRIYKGSFLARNRIVAGLCQGVVVTECGQKSGALMTAKYAREENRNVYAVPGSIFNSTSEGTNWLIEQGASLAVSAQTIIEDLNQQNQDYVLKTVGSLEVNLSEAEKVVLQYIHSGHNTPSQLITAMSQATTGPGQTLAILSQLELKGWVGRELDNSYFIKKNYG